MNIPGTKVIIPAAKIVAPGMKWIAPAKMQAESELLINGLEDYDLRNGDTIIIYDQRHFLSPFCELKRCKDLIIQDAL
jgi:hypothetical protein